MIKFLKEQESEFVVSYNILINVIELFKTNILEDKIRILGSQYDLNEKSPTNSLVAFERAKNDLISQTVKEIMKVYLSDYCLKSLLRYYSVDGLSLLIISHLRR